MRRLKLLASVLTLVALVGIICWQRTKIDAFQAEVATLHQQLEQPAPPPTISQQPPTSPAAPPPASNSAARLTPDETHELLTLRGQVAVLRQQLAEAGRRETHQQAQHEIALHEQASLHLYREARQLDDDARLFHAATYALSDIEQALNVPEWVRKLKPREAVRDEQLKPYWPYFDYKARYDELREAYESSVEGHKKALRLQE